MKTGEFVRDGRERLPQPRFVLDIDPFTLEDVAEQKAVLAMQATRLFIDGDPRFEAVNAHLQEVAAAANRPASVTYEDMIFTNDHERPYVMSRDPKIADVEAGFYRAHHEVEQQMYAAVASLVGEQMYWQSTSNPHNPHGIKIDFDDLRSPEEHLKAGRMRALDLYKSMTREEFTTLREVFVGINGMNGASGLHSSSIPLIDFLVHGGQNMHPGDYARIGQAPEVNLHPTGQPYDLLLEAAVAGNPIQLNLDPEFQKVLTENMNMFRRSHAKSVERYLPDVASGKAEGSGGTTLVGEYFKSKMQPIDRL